MILCESKKFTAQVTKHAVSQKKHVASCVIEFSSTILPRKLLV